MNCELTKKRAELAQIERWVIKVGSAILTDHGKQLSRAAMQDWCAQIAALHRAGKKIVVVTSGAVAVGMQKLGWQQRPQTLAMLQTAAAVGQMQLTHAWQEAFAAHGIVVAQVLLTHDDAADRKRYLNIKSSLQTMGALEIVAIVNENDSVSYEEIRFGDNDNLGAMVANITLAGGYIILTDQRAMYDKNPMTNDDATPIKVAYANDARLATMAGKEGGKFGSGGMYTKVLAAQKAARSGTHTLLAYGREEQIITRLVNGEDIGTFFVAAMSPQQARKQWLGSQLQLRGKLFLDEGAAQALSCEHKSLLAVGVTKIEGEFRRGELVACYDEHQCEIARGLINYNSDDCRQFAGKNSSQIREMLHHGDTLIHRDNLILGN